MRSILLMSLAVLAACQTTGRREAVSSPLAMEEASVADVELFPQLATPPGSGLRWLKLAPLPGPDGARSTFPGRGATLKDLAAHLAPADGAWRERDPATFAREAMASLHRQTEATSVDDVRPMAGFYIPNGQTITLSQPLVRKSRVARFVPDALRGPRFAIKVTGDGGSEERPLRLLQEWQAYAVAARAALEAGAIGEGTREALDGTMEFTVYGLALALTVASDDPRYFAEESAFSELVALTLEQSMSVLRDAAQRAPLARAALFNAHRLFTTSDEAAPLRQFAKRLFGSEWTDQVLLKALQSPRTTSLRDGPAAYSLRGLEQILNQR